MHGNLVIGIEGEPVANTKVLVTMEDENGATWLTTQALRDEPDPVSDELGEFTAHVVGLGGECKGLLEALLEQEQSGARNPPLPDFAFIVVQLVGSGDEIRIRVSADMITRNPESYLDDMDLGTVLVP